MRCAILFVLLGFEPLVMEMKGTDGLAGLALIPLVLLARFISIGIPVSLIRVWRPLSPHVVKLLTLDYVIVIFSIVVQGLTTCRVVQRLVPAGPGSPVAA